ASVWAWRSPRMSAGVISSGSRPSRAAWILDRNIATRDIAVIEKNHRTTVAISASLVDMESSAIIQVCQKFKVRCHLFKFVTDTLDHPSEGVIKKHIRQYRLPFYQFVAGAVMPVLPR
ncbi:MAG: hypothetical protein R6U27_05240, partial [Desulfobacterales bacterium]